MDIKELEALLARVDERTDGDSLERLKNGARISCDCADFIRENGRELLRIYRAWEGAAVGECSAAGRMELDGDSVCGFFISTSADELRRNPFGQRVRLVPDDGQGGAG